uniref:DUF4283 domain-containing protein n=1 Tax=Cannabis sativa TaxID=3483 RepID=A0A803NL62_CANSA
MDAILGIEPIDFTDEEDNKHEPDFEQLQALSPRSSLCELQRQDDIRSDFAHFLEANHSCSRDVSKGNSPVPPILRSGSVIRSLDNSFQEASTEKQKPDNEKVIVKVTMDDIEGEIEYWNSAIVCYVLGANPPLDVLEGFARRIWRRKWIRILVEVSMEQELPSSIAFEDEHGCITSVGIKYEWKPIICKNCNGLGHSTDECRRKPSAHKQQWVVKNKKGELKEDIEVRSGADTNGCTTAGTNSGVNLNTNSGVNPPVTAAESHKGKKPVGLADNDGFKQVHKGLKVNGRMILWQDLKAISTQDPWVVMGDFNDVLEQEERIGSRVKTLTSYSFKDCVSQCQLEDIKSSGKFFTWCNKQQGDDRIYSKLDRVMANGKLMEKYPGAKAIFLNEGAFDHSPALVIFHQLAHNGRKPFCYFIMWISHPKYSSRLQHIWQQQLSLDPLNQELQQKELAARSSFSQTHKNYQQFLQQKAKTTWVRDGDDNTTIFHASLKARINQNRILSIVDPQGNRVDEPTKITEVFLAYYKQLLGTRMVNRREVLDHVIKNGPTVTMQQRVSILSKLSTTCQRVAVVGSSYQ